MKKPSAATLLTLMILPAVATAQRAPTTGTRTKSLLEAFERPNTEARPFVRWWWNGNRITVEEIDRQLALMAEAGIGGVEINPIRQPDRVGEDAPQAVTWLNPEWNALVRRAADQARGHGMLTDLIVGSGWPFGGRFLEPEEQIQILRLRKLPLAVDTAHEFAAAELLTFPKGRRGSDFLDDPPTDLQFLLVVPARCESIRDVVDVTGQLQDGSLRLAAASSPRHLFVGAVQTGFRAVVHGAPGADGPVLDHFNRQAVEKYLARMSDQLGPALGGRLGDALRAMFCDSIELGGADWTSDLPEVFEQRRGYPLRPWLPFIGSENAGLPFGHLAEDIERSAAFEDLVRRARHDYSLTLCELLEERFIRPFHEWCNAQGTQSRYQAYGMPWLYGMLDGYLVPDIPEGDLWIHFPRDTVGERLDLIRYAVWNKYASSAAHLTGKRLVSCESSTNLQGVFRATLEDLKQAADVNFLTGANHSVLHGFNHSPASEGFPGWIRYGTYLSPHNPWWPHFQLFSSYHARVAAVLQASQPVADVAILGPRADVWADHGLERSELIRRPAYLHEIWQTFQQCGVTADYVNERVLRNATAEAGLLVHGPMRYRLLVVVEVEALDPAAAETIAQFAASGGKVAFLGRLPSRTPAMQSRGFAESRLRNALGKARRSGARVMAPPGDRPLLTWTDELLKSFDMRRPAQIDQPDPRLWQIHHRAGNRDVFFFANLDRERTLASRVALASEQDGIEFWDPQTGARRGAAVDAQGRINLELGPLESVLVVTGPEANAPRGPEAATATSTPVAGPWRVELRPMEGTPSQRTLTDLVDLGRSEDETLAAFSGVAEYRQQLTAEQVTGARELDLGEVPGVSEVLWNGRLIGRRWFGRHRYELPPTSDPVTLTIRVTTSAANHARSLDDPIARRWTNAWRDKSPAPAGLIGPVTLRR